MQKLFFAGAFCTLLALFANAELTILAKYNAGRSSHLRAPNGHEQLSALQQDMYPWLIGTLLGTPISVDPQILPTAVKPDRKKTDPARETPRKEAAKVQGGSDERLFPWVPFQGTHGKAHSPTHATDDASHRGHGDASHGGDGDQNGLGYSLCLIGAVAFNMSLLYLINHDDPGMKLATWQVLSMTLSIFSAVLAYVTIREICVDALFQGVYATMAASMTLFVAIYVINEGILYCLKDPDNVHMLHSGAALGCHLLGFAASYAFADVQRSGIFGASFIGHLLVVVLAVAVLSGLAGLSRLVHNWVEHLHQASREHLADLMWEREVELMENEAMSLCIGYLLVQTIAFAIRGSQSSADADVAPVLVTQSHANEMLVCALLFAAAIIGSVYAVTRILQSRGLRRVDTLNFDSYAAEHLVDMDLRALMIMQNSLGVAMAWCFLFWAEWQVYTLGFNGPRSAACMLVGLCLTLLAFASIFILESIAEHIHTSGAVDPEKVVRSMTLALGIVIGFAWERSFHVGLHDIAGMFNSSYISQSSCMHLMVVVLIVIVTPAWAMYVFPMVDEAKIDGHAKYAVSARSMRSIEKLSGRASSRGSGRREGVDDVGASS